MEKPAAYNAFATTLSDPRKQSRGLWETSELLMVADMVREMQQHPGWAALQTVLGAHMDTLTDEVILRPHPDPSQNARRAGVVAGLRAARDAADSILYAAFDRARDDMQHERETVEHGGA